MSLAAQQQHVAQFQSVRAKLLVGGTAHLSSLQITGLAEAVCRQRLQTSNWNVEAALDAYFNSNVAPPATQCKGLPASVPLRVLVVKAEVVGMVAQVEVTQRYVNADSAPIEAVFKFRQEEKKRRRRKYEDEDEDEEKEEKRNKKKRKQEDKEEPERELQTEQPPQSQPPQTQPPQPQLQPLQPSQSPQSPQPPQPQPQAPQPPQPQAQPPQPQPQAPQPPQPQPQAPQPQAQPPQPQPQPQAQPPQPQAPEPLTCKRCKIRRAKLCVNEACRRHCKTVCTARNHRRDD